MINLKSTAIRAVNAALSAIPNPWAGEAWGIDVYDPAVLSLPLGSVDFVGLRIGWTSGATVYKNPNFAAQVQAVWDAGAIPLAYWIVQPDFYINKGWTANGLTGCTDDAHPVLNAIKEQLRAGNGWKKVGGIFWDCESAGNEVWEALYVDDIRGRIRNQQSKNEFPKMLQGIYSRANWINSRVHIRTLIENHPELMVWTANYLSAYPGKFSAIAEKRVNELPLATQKPIWYGDNAAKPKDYPRMWQYHGTFNGANYSTCPEVTADGKPMGLDLNVMECTRAELFKMVGWNDPLVAPPPVDPPPPPVEPPAGDLATLRLEFEQLRDRIDRHLLP